MLRLEKERLKLLEKEKIKMPKASGSTGKNSTSNKLNNSTSKSSNSKTKSNNQDSDNGVDSAVESDPRSVSRGGNQGDLGVRWDGDRDRERDRDRDRERERQEGNSVSIALKDKTPDSLTDDKKNLKLGKLGKFSKLARSYNAGDGGTGVGTGSGSGSGYDGMGDTHTTHGMARSAVTPNPQSTPGVSTDMSVRTPGQGVNPTPNTASAPSSSSSDMSSSLPPTTPGGTQMKMLVHAAGSQLGGMCDDPNPPEVKVHVPNKVGRPKLSFKEKVRQEILMMY